MSYSLAFTQAIALSLRIGSRTALMNVEYVSAKELSETLSIPRPTVVSIVSKLVNAGIVVTKEGINGGVRLNRNPDKITLYDVFEAIESNKPMFRRDLSVNINKEDLDVVSLKIGAIFDQAEESMKGELKKVLLSDLFC